MTEKKYILLRSKPTMVPSAFEMGPAVLGGMMAGGSAEPGSRTTTADLFEIEHAELSVAEQLDLRSDPRTLAMAEPMPMKLIEPTAIEAVVAPLDEQQTWGVKAVGASDSSFSGTGITVAVLDTGIDPGHPAFQGVTLVQKNFTQGADNDEHGHGTHCAGTIFGQDINNQRIGIARDIERALIGKVLGVGGGSSATISDAIHWAVNEGANIISMSLGIDFPGAVKKLIEESGIDVEPATSMALEAYRNNVNLFTQMARFVESLGPHLQGSIIVAASGNESNRPQYEIAVAPPAAGTGIVAVGALQEGADGLSVARFSNNQVNISAPGVDVISAAPGGGLASMSGTSMATPHVAGVAALWAGRQLAQTGRVDRTTLMARLIASGNMTNLKSGAETEDVGTGIVQSPI